MTGTLNAPLVVRHDADAVRTLTIDRASKANALSAAVINTLHDELDHAVTDRVRVLVIRGGERHFSAGFDLSDLDQETDATLLERFVRVGLLLERLAEAPFVTVAFVDGAAVGAGADLAVVCDHRFGTSNASFRFPGAGFGAVLGVRRLSGVVGTDRAMRIVTGGTKLAAPAAAECGVLTMHAERTRLEDAVLALGVETARVPLDVMPSLLRASRPVETGAGLAELVRSLATKRGLRQRIQEYTTQAFVVRTGRKGTT